MAYIQSQDFTRDFVFTIFHIKVEKSHAVRFVYCIVIAINVLVKVHLDNNEEESC
jgi:hypothetical protein